VSYEDDNCPQCGLQLLREVNEPRSGLAYEESIDCPRCGLHVGMVGTKEGRSHFYTKLEEEK